jgi:hypothetical protein
MANARTLAALFQTQRSPVRADDFAEWLNRGDKSALAQLPGFLPAENALNKETDKGQALQQMEALNIDKLPVVDEKKSFAGIVDRSRLTASLLLDVAKNLEKK